MVQNATPGSNIALSIPYTVRLQEALKLMKWDSENFKKLSHQRGKFRKKINKHKNKGCLINHIITISRIELTAENDLSEGGKGNSNPRLHFKLQLSEGEFLESNFLGTPFTACSSARGRGEMKFDCSLCKWSYLWSGNSFCYRCEQASLVSL